MTQSTEQLHQLLELVLTELDRKAIPIAYMQDIDRKGKAFIEQAARRAQVVPQGWKLVPVEPTAEMVREGHKFFPMDAPTQLLYERMLAAAPQPPETQPKSCIPEIQPIGCKEAAPTTHNQPR